MGRTWKLQLVWLVLLAQLVPKVWGDINADLRDAAGEGKRGTVQKLLDGRADLEARDEDGYTALILASKHGQRDTVKVLLDSRADPEARNKGRATALIWAADSGSDGTAALLLAHRADIEARSSGGSPALMWAAAAGRQSTAELLLDSRAQLEARDQGGRTSLIWAARKGHQGVLRLLVDRRAHVALHDASGWTALDWAADRGHENAAELLLDNRADVNACDQEGRTPLIWAAGNGHKDTAKVLLDRRADVHMRDKHAFTALMWALEKDHSATANILIEGGANLHSIAEWNNSGSTQLLMAVANGNTAKIKQLLEDGADVEVRDGNGWTPLMWAAFSGHNHSTQMLLKAGADTEAGDENGLTALMWAARSGKEATVKQLIDHGADPGAKTAAGLEAVDFARSEGRLDVLAAVPELEIPATERYRRLWNDWRLWAMLAGCALSVSVIVALKSRKESRRKSQVQRESLGASRGAMQLAVKALFPRKQLLAAKLFRAAEVFANVFLPIRLMLVVSPMLCVPAFVLTYLLPNWALSGKAPWDGPLAMQLLSARETLLVSPARWKWHTRWLYALGIVRAVLVAGSLFYFSSELQCGCANQPPWYCNAKGKEVTDLMQHNQQQTYCLGFDPLQTPWQMSGPCEVDEGCIMSPNYPEEYDPNVECSAAVPRFSAVYTKHFRTEQYFDVVKVNNVSYSGDKGPPEVFAGGFPGGLIWGCLARPPNITFRSDGKIFGAWKLCRRPELCVPLLPVKDAWWNLNAVGAALFAAWAAAAALLPVMWWDGCCSWHQRAAEQQKVHKLAERIEELSHGGPFEADALNRLDEPGVRVTANLMLRSQIYFTLGIVALDMLLDLNCASNLLLNLDFAFAFCILTVAASSLALVQTHGEISQLRDEINQIADTGFPTERYLYFLDQEHGTEAFVSLCVTLYALPFSIRSSLQILLTTTSLATSTYGIVTLLHERIDLMGLAEGAERAPEAGVASFRSLSMSAEE